MGKTDILFFSSDADRADFVHGKAVGRVLDPLRFAFEQEGYQARSVSYPGGKIAGAQTLNDTISISRLIGFAEIRQNLRKLVKLFVGKSVGKGQSSAVIAYSRLLAALQPKFIFVIDAYPEICRAAWELQIPIIEVLHARGYGDVHESWKKSDSLALPDGVIAYDDLSAETFARFFPTLRVPNYRLSFELEISRKFLETSPPPFPRDASRYRHVILFTTSYNPAEPSWLPGGLPRELVDFVWESDDLFLLVRMHPVMRVEPEYSALRATLQDELRNRDNCDIEWASTAPLYAALQVATIHFTYNSMSSYEAADLGLRTHAVGMWGVDYGNHMRDLRESGIVVETEAKKSVFEAALAESASDNPQTEIEGELDLNRILRFSTVASAVRRNQVSPEIRDSSKLKLREKIKRTFL